ncbi:Para-aminobenzoate synthase component 1 [Alloiococcus otitis]|uniref:aminodeoxychorismate synthase n=1 Tax=Alloiococcus otitis ATCC 51267 TaxID=883081 RepID=K9E9R1_9LACT|nr:aminodeoxychorismate synthase component I [Alloiococcus otitis]EKU93413.1 aminodeoxychorismate synthase, component I [Alloiococcus otitis ATCC 51267]SUU81630.1 Para-aminobenzoate synthase component 1 [Alloiococcus otitis]
MKSLIIDNYDSYTYNLYQLIGKVTGKEPMVIKNDQMTYQELLDLDFDNVIISPGPGSPDRDKDFGLCRQVIEELDKPIFGICLGHQGIYYYNGGNLVGAAVPMHGRQSSVYHNGKNIFDGIDQGFEVNRYHSIVCEDKELENIQIDARTDDGIVMALSHKTKPIYGVQFHPESIATQYGEKMMENFMALCQDYYNQSSLYYEKVPGTRDSQDLYDQLAKIDDQVLWLDSSKVESGLSRFSIFGMAGPKRGHTLKYDVDQKAVKKQDSQSKPVESFQTDIFSYLKANRPKWPYEPALPFDFQLGYIGYIGYEVKKDTVQVHNKHQSPYPDAYFTYCDRALVYDHQEKDLYFLSYQDDQDWIQEVKDRLNQAVEAKQAGPIGKQDFPRLAFVKNKADYIKDIETIQDLIKAGESYEVCLTNRLDIEGQIDGLTYYKHLRRESPGQYSAFLPLDGFQVLSSSMERFINVDQDRVVTTKPIKGTVRRGTDDQEDQDLIEGLRSEEKTKAENLMIVDLLRNDLGRFCEIGSVEVPKLMDVETYSTLHQLVTTVSGRVKEDIDVVEVLENTFPGGSMTGAPKKRTLEIIDDLEDVPRGIYSGTIGFLANNSTMDFNIVIRTSVVEADKASIGLGGAIVMLSDPEEEFDEVVLKAKGALSALQAYYQTDDPIKIEGSNEGE